jgi:hypothetical protein
LYRGISDFKKSYKPILNIIKYDKGDLFTDSHSTAARWSELCSQLLNVFGVNDIRQRDIHTPEPLVPDPSEFELEMVIEMLKNVKISSY